MLVMSAFTPFVTGVAALIKSENPSLNSHEITESCFALMQLTLEV